ncbi:hypothetical protein [Microbacterium aurantiacum]|uniref:hypothetical protein n=1 Tax=Microbacterium aurantiacum TaxID=162393 RepID=UPI003D73B5B0
MDFITAGIIFQIALVLLISIIWLIIMYWVIRLAVTAALRTHADRMRREGA